MKFEHSALGMVFREYSIDGFGRYAETFINETLIYRMGSKPLILELS